MCVEHFSFFLVCYFQMIFVGSHLAIDRLWVILHDCDRAFVNVCDILFKKELYNNLGPLQYFFKGSSGELNF